MSMKSFKVSDYNVKNHLGQTLKNGVKDDFAYNGDVLRAVGDIASKYGHRHYTLVTESDKLVVIARPGRLKKIETFMNDFVKN